MNLGITGNVAFDQSMTVVAAALLFIAGLILMNKSVYTRLVKLQNEAMGVATKITPLTLQLRFVTGVLFIVFSLLVFAVNYIE